MPLRHDDYPGTAHRIRHFCERDFGRLGSFQFFVGGISVGARRGIDNAAGRLRRRRRDAKAIDSREEEEAGSRAGIEAARMPPDAVKLELFCIISD